MHPVHKDISHVLFSEVDIAEKTALLGRTLAEEYSERRPVLVAALSGAFVFLADLVRNMQPLPSGLHIDFVRASSYLGGATTTSGDVKVGQGAKIEVKDRHVLLVEDIIDTGSTALKLKEMLLRDKAKTVRLVCLLDKSERRTCDISPDYCCFQCPNEFVVGYGLDYNEEYRSLPYVGVLRPSLYQQ